MKSTVTIVVSVAVVAILVVGGVAAASSLFNGSNESNSSNNSGGNGNTNPYNPNPNPGTPSTNDVLTFKNHYFDVAGAQSLAIVNDSNSVGSKIVSSTMAVNSVGGNAVMPALGDGVSSDHNALYKRNHGGDYEKVKLYKDKETMDSRGEEVKNEYTPLTLEITDNGKYATITVGILPPSYYNMNSQQAMYHIITIVVSLETGKIYPLPDNNPNMFITMNNYDDWYSYYNSTLFYSSYSGQYKYIGSSDSALYYTIWDNNVYHLYSAEENNNELSFNEIFNNKVVKNAGPYKIYNHDIIRVFSNTMWSNKDSYLIFLGGGISNVHQEDVLECGNYLCTAVTYYDPVTKYFPSSATIITGYDTGAHAFITETVDYTEEESYAMAIQTQFNSEIYKDVGTDSTILVTMKAYNSITKIRLNNDCTFDILGDTELPFVLGPLNDNGSINDDTGHYWDGIQEFYYNLEYYDYVLRNNHICQVNASQSCCGITDYVNPGDIIVNDGFIYKVVGNSLKRFDLINEGEIETISVPELVAVSSLDIEGSRAILEGLSDSGNMIKGTLDFETREVDLQHSYILREVSIAAIN